MVTKEEHRKIPADETNREGYENPSMNIPSVGSDVPIPVTTSEPKVGTLPTANKKKKKRKKKQRNNIATKEQGENKSCTTDEAATAAEIKIATEEESRKINSEESENPSIHTSSLGSDMPVADPDPNSKPEAGTLSTSNKKKKRKKKQRKNIATKDDEENKFGTTDTAAAEVMTVATEEESRKILSDETNCEENDNPSAHNPSLGSGLPVLVSDSNTEREAGATLTTKKKKKRKKKQMSSVASKEEEEDKSCTTDAAATEAEIKMVAEGEPTKIPTDETKCEENKNPVTIPSINNPSAGLDLSLPVSDPNSKPEVGTKVAAKKKQKKNQRRKIVSKEEENKSCSNDATATVTEIKMVTKEVPNKISADETNCEENDNPSMNILSIGSDPSVPVQVPVPVPDLVASSEPKSGTLPTANKEKKKRKKKQKKNIATKVQVENKSCITDEAATAAEIKTATEEESRKIPTDETNCGECENPSIDIPSAGSDMPVAVLDANTEPEAGTLSTMNKKTKKKRKKKQRNNVSIKEEEGNKSCTNDAAATEADIDLAVEEESRKIPTDETNCEEYENPSMNIPSLASDLPIPVSHSNSELEAGALSIVNKDKQRNIIVSKEGEEASKLCTTDAETAAIDVTATTQRNKKRNRDLNRFRNRNRTFQQELQFLHKVSRTKYRINIGFVPNMKIPADVFVNDPLEELLLTELKEATGCDCDDIEGAENGDGKGNDNKPSDGKSKGNGKGGGKGSGKGKAGFIPALKQLANVAALPGIVRCLAMPDVHSGYGFCIGNVAAFDMDDEEAIISPGGVGFDINCGVRLIRTNLTEDDVSAGEVRERIAQAMFDHIPVGVGTEGVIPVNKEDIDDILQHGIDWAIRKGYAWEEDKCYCEENGCMTTADANKVSQKAKKRGLNQIGTLGGGNHYAEVQVVEEIYDTAAAESMGINIVGQVCIMIHTGSRGLGHQVATDALQKMDKAMHRDGIKPNDRQLSCARINSQEGQNYLAAMSAAANYAWVNRSCITYLTRRAFSKVFEKTPEEMGMELVYDVCHNVAKVEKHIIDGEEKTLLVHRKGSTRAFPPNHPMIPEAYQKIGQPALIGGTMGTCSYIVVGTDDGMSETFGSTCHGAGRALSRNASRKRLDYKQVLDHLKEHDISIRVSSPKLVTEEAPQSYKDVSEVVDTCHDAGISRKAVKLRPIAVIKG